MDLKRFDSANIRLCTQCSYPFYSDTHKNFFGQSCKLCETVFENTKPNFRFKGNLTTKYNLLLNAIRFSIDNHDLNTLLGTNLYPIQNSLGDSNLLEQSRTQWEYLPIKKINLRLSEFDRLEYHGLNRIYSEHNLYEFLLLSNLLLRDNNIPELTANVSKYFYSLFRFSCLNPPNPVHLETKLIAYNSKPYKLNPNRTETRKEHIEKHLHTKENELVNDKSSCRPWIRSTNFSRAIHEINRFIANNLSPSHCVCFRFANSLLQLRVFYTLSPALIMIINDQPIERNRLDNTDKPHLVTCYTTSNLAITLRELCITHNSNTNILPDFMGGIALA
jgi:hypothetical protein